MRRSGVVIAVLGALIVGCGTSNQRATLRISGENGIGPVLSRADLRSAHAYINPQSQPILLLTLTRNGRRGFFELMNTLSLAGRRHHRPFHVSISVNGRVIEVQPIGYRGPEVLLPAGIVVDVRSRRAARDLAAKLNR